MEIRKAAILVIVLTLLTGAKAANAQGTENEESQPNGGPSGPPDIGAAVNALKTSLELKVRLNALHYLGEFGPEAASATPTLIGVLDEQHAALRLEAIIALERIGPAAKAAIPALIAILNGHNAELSHHQQMVERAIDALGGMGHDAVKAVPDLVRFLKSDDQSRSAAAGLALARLLPRGSDILQEAVPILVKALRRKQPSTRGDATRALALIGPPALPLLIEVIERQAEDPE